MYKNFLGLTLLSVYVRTSMEYKEAVKLNLLECERRCADQVLEALKRCKQEKNFILDKLTVGDGSCCMSAVLQQMARPEIYENLNSDLKNLAEKKCSYSLREKVQKFIISSRHSQIEEYRNNYSMTHPEISWSIFLGLGYHMI